MENKRQEQTEQRYKHSKEITELREKIQGTEDVARKKELMREMGDCYRTIGNKYRTLAENCYNVSEKGWKKYDELIKKRLENK